MGKNQTHNKMDSFSSDRIEIVKVGKAVANSELAVAFLLINALN